MQRGKEKDVGEKDIKALVSPLHQCTQIKEEMQTSSTYNFLNIQTMSLPQSTAIKERERERKILDTTKQAVPDLREKLVKENQKITDDENAASLSSSDSCGHIS